MSDDFASMGETRLVTELRRRVDAVNGVLREMARRNIEPEITFDRGYDAAESGIRCRLAIHRIVTVIDA